MYTNIHWDWVWTIVAAIVIMNVLTFVAERFFLLAPSMNRAMMAFVRVHYPFAAMILDEIFPEPVTVAIPDPPKENYDA